MCSENVNTQHVGNKTDKRFYVQTSAVKISPDSSVNNDVSVMSLNNSMHYL